MRQQLIFVYNADSGLFNSLTDFTHKIISPATYECSLCALTYGNFSMKQEWKEFIQQLPYEAIFLHKNEFEKSYRLNKHLPTVFIKDDALTVLVSNTEIDDCNTLQQLKDLILLKLSLHGQHHHTNI